MKRIDGFTLIELIITIVILGIISVVLGSILLNAYNNFIVSQNISDAEWNCLLAIERLSNDIHTIRSFSDITIAQANQLQFTDVSGSVITYQVSGGNLLRNSQVLANNVNSFALNFLDKNGNITAIASNVRAIDITVATFSNNYTSSLNSLINVRGFA